MMPVIITPRPPMPRAKPIMIPDAVPICLCMISWIMPMVTEKDAMTANPKRKSNVKATAPVGCRTVEQRRAVQNRQGASEIFPQGNRQPHDRGATFSLLRKARQSPMLRIRSAEGRGQKQISRAVPWS